MSRTPSPTEKHYREYKQYLAGCRGRHLLQKNAVGNINVTQRDVEDAIPYILLRKDAVPYSLLRKDAVPYRNAAGNTNTI